jgi:hypothetical protein
MTRIIIIKYTVSNVFVGFQCCKQTVIQFLLDLYSRGFPP